MEKMGGRIKIPTLTKGQILLTQTQGAPVVSVCLLVCTENVTLKDTKLIPTLATHSSNHFILFN